MTIQIRPTRAVYALGALTVIAIVVSVSLLLGNLRSRAVQHANEETASLTRMLREHTEQAFEGADLALRGIQDRLQSSYGRVLPLDSMPIHLLLTTRSLGMRQVQTFFIADADGRVVNSSHQYPAAGLSAADRDYFRAFADRGWSGLFVGKPLRGRGSGTWTLHLARPIQGADGEFRGVVVAAIKLDYFEQLYNFVQLDYPRPIALYEDDGRLVASLPRRDGERGDFAAELKGVQLPTSEDDTRTLTHVSGDGSKRVFTLAHVMGFPLLVSITDDRVDALASWRETAAPIALGAVLMCLFIGIATGVLAMVLRREEALSRALKEADDRYQRTIESVMDAIVAVDDSLRITLFNRAAERMFGIPAEAAIGAPLNTLVPARLRDAHDRHTTRFMRSEEDSRRMAPQLGITGLHADGHEFPIESTISQTVIHGERQLTAVLRDITERRRAEAELRQMNLELRRLSAALQSVREEERARISRELHDELGQQLTGLKLDLSWLSSRLKEGRRPAPETIDSMRRLLDAAIVAVRRISAELRPRILDDLGFGEAVSWQSGEFAKRSGVQVSLDLPAATLVTSDTVATALFRIVQESLTNVARHAEARSVGISLRADDDSLVLRVADDGRGMDADDRRDGIGLVSMRERAAALGGHFSIDSRPGAGTVVEVRVPAGDTA